MKVLDQLIWPQYNKLFGTNTDGLGALQSIKETLKEKSLNFLLLKKQLF